MQKHCMEITLYYHSRMSFNAPQPQKLQILYLWKQSIFPFLIFRCNYFQSKDAFCCGQIYSKCLYVSLQYKYRLQPFLTIEFIIIRTNENQIPVPFFSAAMQDVCCHSAPLVFTALRLLGKGDRCALPLHPSTIKWV